MSEKARNLAREMAKKAAESTQNAEKTAHLSEETAKDAMNAALQKLYAKHPELAGKVTFGDAYLPGSEIGKDAGTRAQSKPDAKLQTSVSVDLSVSVDAARDKGSSVPPHSPDSDTRDTGDDDFWSMPAPKASAYRPPSLQGHSLDTVSVESDTAAEPVTESIPIRDEQTIRLEKQRVSSRFTRPADRTYPSAPAPTPVADPFPDADSAHDAAESDPAPDSRRFTDADFAEVAPKKQTVGEIVAERDGKGALLRHITIRTWVNDFVFYGRFARDAQRSHRQVGNPAFLNLFVPFTSYLPQYSQMSRNQLSYYLAFRDSVRSDSYPAFTGAGTAYILLYAYEIINLPNEIPPETGMRLLCGMWHHYRESDPRIDTFFGEWVADYSLIHDVPLSPVIYPCLPQIVKKAQFKEFYLDTFLASDDAMALVTSIFMEGFSDYDYKTSRYYRMHERMYDRTMHDVLEKVLVAAYHEGREPFSLTREYRINRDAYAGAIAQTEVKKRLSITFLSFLRSEKPREWVTGVLKYTENRLRKRMALRAKLRVDRLSPADQAVIDAYFGADPETEKKKTAAQREEEAYLRHYEADTHGFDFSAAGAIEKASWDNTVRLTDTPTDTTAMDIHADDDAEEAAENPAVPGEIRMESHDDVLRENPPAVSDAPSTDEENASADSGEGKAYAIEKAALTAALHGQFAAYCRSIGEFPGHMTERINEIFMDEMGDIVLTADYSVLEDYREEAEEWSKS